MLLYSKSFNFSLFDNEIYNGQINVKWEPESNSCKIGVRQKGITDVTCMQYGRIGLIMTMNMKTKPHN